MTPRRRHGNDNEDLIVAFGSRYDDDDTAMIQRRLGDVAVE